MPFDFLKRNKAAAAKPGGASGAAAGGGSSARASGAAHRGISFEGLTEEWRLVGWMEVPGRLSDALNKREPITISDAPSWVATAWMPFAGETSATASVRIRGVPLISAFARSSAASASARRCRR